MPLDRALLQNRNCRRLGWGLLQKSLRCPTSSGLGQIEVKSADLLQPATNDWLSYNGDHTGSRYSTLTEITPANVSHLQAKWVFHSRDAGALECHPSSPPESCSLPAATMPMRSTQLPATSSGIICAPSRRA